VISIDEALGRLADAVEPGEPVDVPLDQAQGLALAFDVHADRDFPPSDRSAMDGYAVRSTDVPGPESRLALVGEIAAGGEASRFTVGPGQAVRLFTGATVPRGADAVVMVERTREEEGGAVVCVQGPIAPRENVRPRASEASRGDSVLQAGTRIGAPEIAALAAVGTIRVRVHRPPVVRIVSTGDELVGPDEVPLEHQIRESNGRMLRTLVREAGCETTVLAHVADRPERLRAALGDGFGADLLLVTGGVSVGAYDLVAPTLERAGTTTLFHGVAMKPGKPVLAARLRRTLVVGLPGNPVSAYVGFVVLVAPALRKMSGRRDWRTQEIGAVLTEPLPASAGRATFHLATFAWRAGLLESRLVPSCGSGDVLALARADGLLRAQAGSPRLAAGEQVPAIPWRTRACSSVTSPV
jgi:molybdopterin molybdotransferase